MLGKDRGYHVRLDGPPERRVAQGASVEGSAKSKPGSALRAADKARTAYVRRLYRTDPCDPACTTWWIDSTSMPLEAVVELVLAAPAPTRCPSRRPRSAALLTCYQGTIMTGTEEWRARLTATEPTMRCMALDESRPRRPPRRRGRAA